MNGMSTGASTVSSRTMTKAIKVQAAMRIWVGVKVMRRGSMAGVGPGASP